MPYAIRDSIENFVYDEKYREFNETFSHMEDGQASARFVATVFPEVKVTSEAQPRELVFPPKREKSEEENPGGEL